MREKTREKGVEACHIGVERPASFPRSFTLQVGSIMISPNRMPFLLGVLGVTVVSGMTICAGTECHVCVTVSIYVCVRVCVCACVYGCVCLYC
jgi:hypothetical protein